MAKGTPQSFYDQAYFAGRTRDSVPHTRETVYPLSERTARFLCRRLRPRNVLDVGCAMGFQVEAFRAQDVTAYGVDISLYAVAHAAAPQRRHLAVAEVEAGLPIRSASVDLITALDVFEHLPEPEPALREIRRALCERGRAYLKICHPDHPNARRDPSHVNVQPLAYWRAVFRRTGFSWARVYEAEFSVERGFAGRLRWWVRWWREWATIGTPADYKFLLWKSRHD